MNSKYKIGDTFFSRKHDCICVIESKEYKESLTKPSVSEHKSYNGLISLNEWLYKVKYLKKDMGFRAYYEGRLEQEFERVDRDVLGETLYR